MNLTVIVPATGQGTRFKSDLPRVVQPLADRPMVRYVVDAARSLDPAYLALVASLADEAVVRQATGDGITYFFQEQSLGAGHAIQQTEQAVAGRSGTVLVIPGDAPLIRPETLRQAVAHHQAEQAAITALAIPEQNALEGASSGIFCFRDEWLWPNLARVRRGAGGDSSMASLVDAAITQGEVVAAWIVSEPLEATSIDDGLKLARAEAEMRRRINERWMLSGVILVHPETTYIGAAVEIGPETVVWPNTYLQGQTRIGDACTIGPGSIIRDSTVGARCKVELSVIEQAIMEAESEIGPFGHLRKGAHLGPGVHMGNFGEVKNSYLGPGVKMGHFSYLGDATVGAEANIGAGTITCNYDGQRKHRTIIGEGAFIGSDSMLVAPVEVGNGARTGAGSVVTRDVPPGKVAYGVPARVKATSTSSSSGAGKEESEGV